MTSTGALFLHKGPRIVSPKRSNFEFRSQDFSEKSEARILENLLICFFDGWEKVNKNIPGGLRMGGSFLTFLKWQALMPFLPSPSPHNDFL